VGLEVLAFPSQRAGICNDQCMRPAAEFAFLDWPGPIAFAHRGDSTSAPENTMAAFEAAVSLGFSYLETDVRATSDGKLVVFHDERLGDNTGTHGTVEQLPWHEVNRARVGGREPIPLMEDLLQAWPNARFNIDPKSDAAVEPLIAAIRRCNAIDRVCIGSFSQQRITATKAALGEKLCTSMGPASGGKLLVGARLRLNLSFDAPCAQLPARLGSLTVCNLGLIAYAHARGVRVHAWTVNDADDMTALLDAGIDGIMTDSLRLLRATLMQRGQWFQS
jgi:glycerophosphoryl diester phosphodiesterase